MTTSVDEAVYDYFSLLLTEVEEEQGAKVEEVQADISVIPDIEVAPSVKERAAEPLSSEADSFENHGPDVSRFEVETPQAQQPNGFDASVLHSEETLQTQLKPKEKSQTESQALPKSKVRVTDANLDKLALEQLLAPVFKPEPQIETESVVKLENQTVAKVKAAPPKESVKVKPEVAVRPEIKAEIKQKQEHDVELKTQLGEIPPKVTKDLLEMLDDEFQVLFFKVAGLTLAVPLVSLGGIVKIERINHIMGRPPWYKGVQTYRDSQLNVVDTCAWVMPEKYDEALAESVNYQYVVLLEDSNWGLTCESLVNAVRITKSEVNWRSKAGKRPWLAGVVKEQMCGILHVQALIELLNSGLGSQDPVG
ncbi:chemotaxis protein CheW [Shewanella atlantica]|uniref:chemotaxis protein CheW n=1 Tax=Shewanella atlantica TaxID=271099 RepID=UPI003735FA5B